MGLVEDFANLFEGRKDAYGVEQGGAFRPGEPFENNEHYWLETIQRHLDGTTPIGVYPMVCFTPHDLNVIGLPPQGKDYSWWVKWGCVDFDIKGDDHRLSDYDTEDEAHEAALNLHDVLASFEITSWIERTRSGGRHVWVFAETWVPAATMRRALIVACELAGASTREVNPKAEEGPDEKYLGNYVRLPYPNGANLYGPLARRAMIRDSGEAILLDWFVEQAVRARATAGQLGGLAQYYVPPKVVKIANPKRVEGDYDIVDLTTDITSKLSGLAYTILNDGPLPDGDRSTTLMRLAHLCREDGLDPDEAMAVVTAADMSWGKFHSRADGERRLEQMVQQAFADWEELSEV